ncbi:hypothetical protein TEA_024515 [Camellia sinensis var. sinensis]|uniref:Peptidase M16 N-terminal domain-containing protein n=1 Tax=Camellia sinensis var. sinensis TaxID=542762 RepID=A0A4S4D0Y8_CAMSN|nr:hypothetical protein TEA_024515 [Camellia sinensis var. sinensis]
MAVEVVEILKPRNDKREYRRIVLQNSLQVLLISDPETDKCAASMNVAIGSFSDPVGLEGLAHFLEHMLFYASEKYPLEDSYSKYITEVQTMGADQQILYHHYIYVYRVVSLRAMALNHGIKARNGNANGRSVMRAHSTVLATYRPVTRTLPIFEYFGCDTMLLDLG